MDDLDDAIVRKLTWRLMPVLTFGYFVAVLDRSNVGVAALTMNSDLGLSMTAFGVAAGIFFVPYVLLELPSNLALARFGARMWMARIMITWGLISGAHALVWDARTASTWPAPCSAPPRPGSCPASSSTSRSGSPPPIAGA